MNWMRIAPLALSLLAALPAHSQVQFFETDVSGIELSAGIKWNQAITEAMGDVGYTIDGRTTLGFIYSKPLKDTLSFDQYLHAYTLNPYLVFEFVEPDNLKNFSFAVRADLVSEMTSRPTDSIPGDFGKLNNFSRTAWGLGPIFALRIFSSERFIIVPAAAYEISYVTYHRDWLPNNFSDSDYFWHDISGSCAFNYKFNEFNGITFEPKVVAKVGEGRSSKDLINVNATVGFLHSF